MGKPIITTMITDDDIYIDKATVTYTAQWFVDPFLTNETSRQLSQACTGQSKIASCAYHVGRPCRDLYVIM